MEEKVGSFSEAFGENATVHMNPHDKLMSHHYTLSQEKLVLELGMCFAQTKLVCGLVW
jgi:hypothetical protein